MFENETELVKYGIQFLEALLAKDYRQDPTYDENDLREKVSDVLSNAEFLSSNLVPEVADELDEAKEEFADDTLEEDELEDEYVECYNLISRANELAAQVIEKYNLNSATPQIQNKPQGQVDMKPKKKYINWANVFWICVLIGIIVWMVSMEI